MSKYCVKCGRKLADGAICSCRIRREVSGGAGGTQSGVSFRNILKVNDPDFDRGEDYYERGKQIVPELVSPCENEIPIKQYHLVNIRSRLQGLWAEGRLMVTNKRILFRASGRSFIGRTMLEDEYALDEISGLEISRGVRFSIFDFFMSMLLLALCLFLMSKVAADFTGWVIPLLLTAAGAAGLYFLGRRQYRWKLVVCCIPTVCSLWLMIWARVSGHGFWGGFFTLVLVIFSVLLLFFLILSGMKSVVSLSIQCKAGTAEAIRMHSPQHFMLQNASELLPTEETDLAIREVGAMINDIQHFGDLGIEKWKTAASEAQTV